MGHNKTSIQLDRITRQNLRHIGRKDQTYDELISELIQTKIDFEEKLKEYQGANS